MTYRVIIYGSKVNAQLSVLVICSSSRRNIAKSCVDFRNY